MNKVFGISLAVLAIAIAVVPNFTDCASHGIFMNVMGKQLPMICHWSARAEIAVGAPLFAVGGVMAFAHRRSAFYGLGALGIILGALTILLPTHIIGTCPSASDICNTAMKPAAILMGSVAIVGSLGAVVTSRQSKE